MNTQKMYMDDSSSSSLIARIDMGSTEIGDSSLSARVIDAAYSESESQKVDAAAVLISEIQKALPNNSVDGPPLTLQSSRLYDVELITLPAFLCTGSRNYFFEAELDHPLVLRELWYSHARFFSPIDPDEFRREYQISMDDTTMFRRKIIEILQARGAIFDDFFFPRPD